MKHNMIKLLTLLLLCCQLLLLVGCGVSQYGGQSYPNGEFVVEVDGKKYTLCFESGILYYTDGLELITADRGIYTLVSTKDPDVKIQRKEYASNRWLATHPGETYLEEGTKFKAEYEEKQILVRFYTTENRDDHQVKYLKKGDRINYPTCKVPAGMRFVGWFNRDFTVQYTNGTTPKVGYETVNDSFFGDPSREYIIDIRPKFELAS